MRRRLLLRELPAAFLSFDDRRLRGDYRRCRLRRDGLRRGHLLRRRLLLRELSTAFLPFDAWGLRRNCLRRGVVLLLPSPKALLTLDDGRLRDGIRRGLWSGANRRLLDTPYPAHIHDAHGFARLGRPLANLLDVSRGEWATWISSEPRLLTLEWNRRWRRSCASHDSAALNVGRRTGGTRCGVRPGAENALPLRSHRGSAENLRRRKLT